MLRLSKFSFVTVCCFCIAAGSAATSCAQNERPANASGRQQVDPKLWQLLSDWSHASSQVKKLSGEHQRHAYDRTFGIEKVSTGKFWHEAPDKGRIDVFPVKITDAMKQDRQKKGARVRRDAKGKPYKLESDDQERWICDGENVFDIDEAAKVARIVKLPPQIRGQNIMNSPLPFLFGLPPDQAVERFEMSIKQDWRPKYDMVQLEARPRWRQDAQNWSSAEILLDTSTFLPTAVKLIDPPETKEIVYKFTNLKVNQHASLVDRLFGKTPWDPGLDRSYKLHVIQQGDDAAEPAGNEVAGGPPADGRAPAPQPARGMIPNVIGRNHEEATKMLLAAGVPEAAIRRLNAGPAPRENLTFIVREQHPQANTPVASAERVVLKIFDRPGSSASAAKPATDRR